MNNTRSTCRRPRNNTDHLCAPSSIIGRRSGDPNPQDAFVYVTVTVDGRAARGRFGMMQTVPSKRTLHRALLYCCWRRLCKQEMYRLQLNPPLDTSRFFHEARYFEQREYATFSFAQSQPTIVLPSHLSADPSRWRTVSDVWRFAAAPATHLRCRRRRVSNPPSQSRVKTSGLSAVANPEKAWPLATRDGRWE